MTNFLQVTSFDPLTVSTYEAVTENITQNITVGGGGAGGSSGSITVVDNGDTLSLTPSGTSSVVDNGDTLTITA